MNALSLYFVSHLLRRSCSTFSLTLIEFVTFLSYDIIIAFSKSPNCICPKCITQTASKTTQERPRTRPTRSDSTGWPKRSETCVRVRSHQKKLPDEENCALESFWAGRPCGPKRFEKGLRARSGQKKLPNKENCALGSLFGGEALLTERCRKGPPVQI